MKVQRHNWTPMQRHVLVYMWRYYERVDLQAFTTLFNEVTGLKIKSKLLPAQFGKGAHQMENIQESIYSIPFDDPDRYFDELQQIIEDRATKLGAHIRRREQDDVPPKLKAVFDQVRRRRRAERLSHQSSTLFQSAAEFPAVLPSLQRRHRSATFDDDTKAPAENAFMYDKLLIPKSLESSDRNYPRLGFRVWDSTSYVKQSPVQESS